MQYYALVSGRRKANGSSKADVVIFVGRKVGFLDLARQLHLQDYDQAPSYSFLQTNKHLMRNNWHLQVTGVGEVSL